MFNAKLIKVIETTLELRGKGIPTSPFRRVTQYWSTDGKLLAENDPIADLDTRPCQEETDD